MEPFSILAWLGAGLLLLGELWALRSRARLGRLLLFATLAELGYLMMGLGLGEPLAQTGAWFHLCLQAVMRLSVIVAAWRLIAAAGSDRLDKVAHVAPNMPLSRLMFGFGLFSVMGLSPFKGAFSKFIILYVAVDQGHWLLAAVATVAGIIAAFYTLSVTHKICFGASANRPMMAELKDNRFSVWLMLFAALTTVALSIDPEPLLHWVGAVNGLTDGHGMPKFESPWQPIVLLPYLSGFAVFLIGLFSTKLRDIAVQAVAAGALVMAWQLPMTDAISWLFAVIIALVMLVVCVYSVAYMSKDTRANSYYFFLLLMLGSLLGVVTATDLGNFYLYWELMTWTSYLLVIHPRTVKALKAGRKYFLMCASGAYVMHFGILLLHANLGSFEFSVLAQSAGQLPVTESLMILLCFLVGLGVKAGLWPAHGWLPDAHPVAPSSISAPMSAILTKVGLYGILKMVFVVFGAAAISRLSDSVSITLVVTVLGAITLLYGEIAALKESDLKRMLAFSTLAQVGEITAVLGLGSYLALTGGLAHLLNHAIFKSLLFLCAGSIIYRYGSKTLTDLAGAGRRMPITGVCLAIGLLAIMGLPPFSGFFSKFLMIYAAAEQGSLMLAVLILVGSLIGAVYYLRIFRVLFFTSSERQEEEAPTFMVLPQVLLATLVLLAGLFPSYVLGLVEPVVTQLAPQGGQLPDLVIDWSWAALVACVGAPLVYLIGKRQPNFAGPLSMAVMALSFWLVIEQSQHFEPLSWWFAILVAGVGLLSLLYSKGYMAHGHSLPRFLMFFLLMMGGLIGICSSQDLFNFFLFWEVMSSWTLYFAIIHEESEQALDEGFKYLMFNLFGASCLFLGVVMLAAPSGELALAGLGDRLLLMPTAWSTTAVVLVLAGLLMKAAQMPVRIDVQMHPPTAPTPVSGYISAVLLKSGPFGMLKVFAAIGLTTLTAHFSELQGLPWPAFVVGVIAALTLLGAGAMAMIQTGIKRLLIYSTVSQLAYVLLGLSLLTPLGISAGLLHFVNHMLLKNLLFMGAGVILAQAHLHSLDDLGGLGKRMPLTFGLFLFAGLSLSGIPPLNGFASKWMIYQASLESGHYLFALATLMSSLFTLAAVLKFTHVAFLGRPSEKVAHLTDAPASMAWPMVLTALACVVLGLFPGLALVPIAAIVTSMGLVAPEISVFGPMPGGWSPLALTLALLLPAGACWGFYRLSAPQRVSIHTHSCGVDDLTDADSHMGAAALYESPKALLAMLAAPFKRRES
ncbi:proton-conducting transporter transmembrane domain-containing protein [Ferrimonas aestuarii]|uniref:Oxidoreductase n=1 Tax=Ferrimonas aestuarii TaxID=2569539 RepID=A0A4U1BT90_9GAMM|nr:proton-conducting transporter membrane subunit [Ferrimonas aestuarii]TKB58379.1 oxidoreductase [Ferrimonas aestuarii]